MTVKDLIKALKKHGKETEIDLCGHIMILDEENGKLRIHLIKGEK